MLFARQNYAFGEQHDYFDHPNTIGWTRMGDAEHPEGMAVIMSNGSEGSKHMRLPAANCTYVDLTEHIGESITADEQGWAELRCNSGSVSVWVKRL